VGWGVCSVLVGVMCVWCCVAWCDLIPYPMKESEPLAIMDAKPPETYTRQFTMDPHAFAVSNVISCCLIKLGEFHVSDCLVRLS